MRYPQPSKGNVLKLRIHSKRDTSWVTLKPQWMDSTNEWHDFREGKRLIRKMIPLAKFHGLEILHLSKSRIARETVKHNKWINEWKLSNNSKAEIIEFTTKSRAVSRSDKKKEKEQTTCETCGRKLEIVLGETNCFTCRLESDRVNHIIEEEENSPESPSPDF